MEKKKIHKERIRKMRRNLEIIKVDSPTLGPKKRVAKNYSFPHQLKKVTRTYPLSGF